MPQAALFVKNHNRKSLAQVGEMPSIHLFGRQLRRPDGRVAA